MGNLNEERGYFRGLVRVSVVLCFHGGESEDSVLVKSLKLTQIWARFGPGLEAVN